MDKDKKPFDVIDGDKSDNEPYERIEISISRGGDTVRLLISDNASQQSPAGWNISDELKSALIKELQKNYAQIGLVDEMIITALVMLQGVKYEDSSGQVKTDTALSRILA